MANTLTALTSKMLNEYVNGTPKRCKIIDAYLVYVFFTGVMQFIYCCAVGTFPFNAFLSGFISCVASFILGVGLRLQAAIWHCLNNYAFPDATFLAERLFAEVCSDESLHLLATCYYRAGKLNQAYDVLKKKGLRTPKNKYLMARCCFDLKKYSEAELILNGKQSNLKKGSSVDELALEFGENAAFALQLLASIYAKTERSSQANECDKKSLKLNPFLWKSFESLCNRGDYQNPDKVFNIQNIDNLNFCHGVNPILNLINTAATTSGTNQQPTSQFSPPQMTITSTPNISQQCNVVTPQHLFHTPVNIETPGDHNALPGVENLNDNTGFSSLASINSSFNSSMGARTMMSGIGTLNTTENMVQTDTNILTATQRASNNTLMPPPLKKKVRNNSSPNTMTGKNLAANFSFSTPSFGFLPKNCTAKNDLGSIALKLDFSSPSLSILTPVGYDSPKPSLVDKAPMKQKRNVMACKENPLNQSLLTPGNQNVTPSQSSQSVRRSSRLFGSSQQSVKENSKGPTKKSKTSPQNHSPPRRPKTTRLALTTQTADLAEKNEKNKNDNNQKMPKDISNMISDDVIKKPQQILNINLGAHAVIIQKQSVEGLMQLFKHFGTAYVELSKYNSRKAVQTLESLPYNQYHTGWVCGLIGQCHVAQNEYREAKVYFNKLRTLEPSRMEFMEHFSTALWHLQDDVGLSTLTQEVTQTDKNSAEAWCVAGNCFSHLKEHENAIKYFKRATQVNPSFAYSYTLLGHEYITIEELDQAMSCFRSAVRVDPRHYNAWYGIGLTYYKQERYKLAETYYKKALQINPQNPILMCHVAVVQHQMQKTDRALETLNAALQHAPKNSLCKFERAQIFLASERYKEALQELNELKDLVPKESPVFFLLGKVHTKLNNTHLALMHFSWAMDLDPKGANSQIKEALDPAMNRAAQEEAANATISAEQQNQGEEAMEINDEIDLTSFNPLRGASTSQESLDASTSQQMQATASLTEFMTTPQGGSANSSRNLDN